MKECVDKDHAKKSNHIILICCFITFEGVPSFGVTNPSLTVNRLSGHTRYETAKIISEYYGSGKVHNVIISTRNKFADALSASVLAHEKEALILLVDSSVEKSKDAFDYIINHLESARKVYIIGGNEIIGPEFEMRLNNLKCKSVVRIAGADRYETSCKVATY